MNRRKFMKAAGAASAGFALTGCLGNNAGDGQAEKDQGDETVNNNNNAGGGQPGWFDIDSNVLEEKMGKEVSITRSSLFRTAENFGVMFTVKNKGGAPLTNLTVHAELLDQGGEVIDSFQWVFGNEAESIDDLAVNEKWSDEIIFEDTDPNVLLNDVASYNIWATAQAESGANENGGGNGSGTGSNDGSEDGDGGTQTTTS